MKKEASIQFCKCLLIRAGYVIYEPVASCGHDLLCFKDDQYARIIVLSVNDDKPIIALKSTSSGKASLRDFDVLMCVHLPTLATWQIPSCDVPDKETLYLSGRYDVYKVPFISLDSIVKNTPLLFNKARENLQKDIEDLKNIQMHLPEVKEETYDQINNLLGDYEDDNENEQEE